MGLVALLNGNVVTQPRGSIIRLSGLNALLAQADSSSNAAETFGARYEDTNAAALGNVIPLTAGAFILMEVEPFVGDNIYLSATSAGKGTNVAPSITLILGVCVDKVFSGGSWYAQIMQSTFSASQSIIYPLGGLFEHITPNLSGGSPTGFTEVAGAFTNLVAGAEDTDVKFNLSATKTWLSGAITTQRDFLIQARTYAFSAPSTVTTAATLAISGAPSAGANATITTPLAFWIQAGNMQTAGQIYTTLTGGGPVAGIRSQSTCWQVIGGGADAKYWDVQGSGSNLIWSIVNDANNSSFTFLTITRSAATSITNTNWAVNQFTVTQQIVTSGTPTAFTLTGGAHTTLAASVEDIGANFNFSATKQWGTGAITAQREVVFQAPTYAFVGASTITSAATVAITNAPISGANATITRPYALWVQSGLTLIGGHMAFPTDGLIGFSTLTTPTSSNYALSGGPNYTIINVNNGNIDFRVTNTVYARVFSTGNFGIGTTSDTASTKLKVVASKTIASAAGAVYDGINFDVSTVSITGNTGIATATGFNYVTINAPTYNSDTATCTVTNAASLKITGAPIAGTNVAITNRYGLWIVSNSTAACFEAPFTVAATPSLCKFATASGELGWIGAYSTSGEMYITGRSGLVITAGGSGLGTYNCKFTTTANLILGLTTDVASSRFRVQASKTIASAAGAIWNGVDFVASTASITGATGITTATGFNFASIAAPTISGDTATCTITNAATFTILGAPTAGANVAITNAYAFWVQGGSSRFDARVLKFQGADVASANDITLTTGNYFDITGNTQINRILGTGWTAGTRVTLQFDSNPTVTNNTAAGSSYFGFKLAGSVDFTPTAGSTLTIIFDGAWWREIARTVL